MNKSRVVWSKDITKQLFRLPDYIVKKFYAWVTAIEIVGVTEVIA